MTKYFRVSSRLRRQAQLAPRGAARDRFYYSVVLAVCVSFVLVTLVACGARSRSHGSAIPQSVARIETYLSELDKEGFNGNVLVGTGDRVVLLRTAGFRDLSERKPNTAKTVFDIGSLTKQFTGAAIVKLHASGRLRFDDRVGLYLQGLSGEKANLTIHDLLRHSSGLVSVVGGDYDAVTKEEFIRLVNQSSLMFSPGARFSYSNVGYSLLGMIIEQVSGSTYEQYLRTSLFEPAGMLSTGYTIPSFHVDLIAVGYRDSQTWGRPTDKVWDANGPYWHLKANGGLLSTADDLFKWYLALQKGQMLDEAAYGLYIRPPIRSDEDRTSYYAYGWDVHETPSRRLLIQHNGYNGSFYADFHWFPEEEVVIISLSNKAEDRFRDINERVAEMMFAEQT